MDQDIFSTAVNSASNHVAMTGAYAAASHVESDVDVARLHVAIMVASLIKTIDMLEGAERARAFDVAAQSILLAAAS